MPVSKRTALQRKPHRPAGGSPGRACLASLLGGGRGVGGGLLRALHVRLGRLLGALGLHGRRGVGAKPGAAVSCQRKSWMRPQQQAAGHCSTDAAQARQLWGSTCSQPTCSAASWRARSAAPAAVSLAACAAPAAVSLVLWAAPAAVSRAAAAVSAAVCWAAAVVSAAVCLAASAASPAGANAFGGESRWQAASLSRAPGRAAAQPLRRLQPAASAPHEPPAPRLANNRPASRAAPVQAPEPSQPTSPSKPQSPANPQAHPNPRCPPAQPAHKHRTHPSCARRPRSPPPRARCPASPWPPAGAVLS